MSIWDERIAQAIKETRELERLQRQIAAAKMRAAGNPEGNERDALRELGKEHYRINGASGGA